MYNLKIIIFTLAIVFTWFFANCTPALALDIKSLRFGRHDTATRIVLDLSAEADFRAMTQDSPPRIVLDMPMISDRPAVGRSQLPDLVRDIRIEPLSSGYTRLTFVLAQTAAIRSAFLMPASGNTAARLVIDASPVSQTQFAQTLNRPYGTLSVKAGSNPAQLPFAGISGPQLAPIDGPQAPKIKTPSIEQPAAPKIAGELPLIMIDAGHGGIDPGASGYGVHEKNVTLAAAKDLRDALLKTGKYRVKLTRDKDIFIPLAERVRIARRAGADLFVSIHADSMPGGASATGASFYTLSDQASDAQTARLAARENNADILGGIDLPKTDRDVTTILIDLAMRETTNQSKRFAGLLVNAFKTAAMPMVPGPNRHAGFMVLKAPDVPSVLIELGFLSNPGESGKLNDNAYRQTLAGTIADGIDTWFKTRRFP